MSDGNRTPKLLTPCRTVGLKRKSSFKSPLMSDTSPKTPRVVFSKHKPGSKSKSETPVKSPLKDQRKNADSPSPRQIKTVNNNALSSQPRVVIKYSDDLNFQPFVKLNRLETSASSQELTNSPTQSPSILTNGPKPAVRSHPPTDHPPAEDEDDDQPKTDEDVKQLILRIKQKVIKLDSLKNTKKYTQRHSIKSLQELTQKWKSSSKQILLDLHSHLNAQGKPCEIIDILNQLHIRPEAVDFDVETSDFC